MMRLDASMTRLSPKSRVSATTRATKAARRAEWGAWEEVGRAVRGTPATVACCNRQLAPFRHLPRVANALQSGASIGFAHCSYNG